jgi:hypothetical protein
MSRNPTIRRGKGCIAKNFTSSAGEFLSHFRIKTVITEQIMRTCFIRVQDVEDTTNKDEVRPVAQNLEVLRKLLCNMRG